MITNVTIEKVKGIGYKSFDLEIQENKYNLLVAPNGFGKSSFLLLLILYEQRRWS